MVLRPALLRACHHIPVIEGPGSRRHRPVPVWRLLLAALGERAVAGGTPQPETFVQFAGFPRSGHSLIGALLDAHPAALVSHELDAMGLVANGLGRRSILALIRRNSSEFMQSGRYWNGFSYVLEGWHNGRSAAPRVVGDKKGDWAVRRCQSDPGLLDRLHRTMRMPCKWILVVRNPFDNIATMSMRRGGAYDRARIGAADGREFRERLATDPDIPRDAADAMIDDYLDLCRGVASLKAAVAPGDWHEVAYDRFSRAPVEELAAILGFLRLDGDPAFLRDAAALVRPTSGGAPVAWTEAQKDRVRAAIAEFPFLAAAHDGREPP